MPAVSALQRACEPDPVRPNPAVDHAVTCLGEGQPVQRVADEVGYGRRHLATLVRAETGLSPVQLRRVARLGRSKRAILAQGPAASLARVAAEAGYADQAHLARDWADLAGCSPSVWLREELPFVQAPSGPDQQE